MKKIFTTLTLSVALFAGANAQSAWTSYGEQRKAPEQEVATRSSDTEIYLGHCSLSTEIWPFDGLSLGQDARVGAGIILTNDMFAKYDGGTIVGMWVGWDDEASTSNYECFVRKSSFKGDIITEGADEVVFGWNYISLDEVAIDGSLDALAVGFYTDIVKDVCSIPKLYPYNVDNSSFLWHGEVDENGKEMWYDSKSMGAMPVILVIKDKDGKFVNMIDINDINYDVVVDKDEMIEAIFNISNIGSNEISNIELTSTLGDLSHSELIDFSQAIPAQNGGKIILPIKCLGSGKHVVSVTAVNGMVPNYVPTYEVSFIGVPEEVSSEYVYRPLIEYFVSEEEYASVRFVDEYFWPDFERFSDRMSVIMPHVDDKFMTGDDDALNQLIKMAGGDKMKVYVPGMTISRSNYAVVASYNCNVQGTPMMFTIYPQSLSGHPNDINAEVYEYVLAHPTFASVKVDASIDENGKIKVTASGNVAEGVMPEGEDLYLSVYLMERNVHTLDQMFWDDKESAEKGGEYYHKNVIRELLSPLWGQKLENTGGAYSASFETESFPEYVKDNLYVIAFLNRGQENDNMNLNIINCAEGELAKVGINSIANDNIDLNVEGGKVVADGQVDVYNLSGARVENANLAPGIYVVKAEVEGSVVVKKIIVK